MYLRFVYSIKKSHRKLYLPSSTKSIHNILLLNVFLYYLFTAHKGKLTSKTKEYEEKLDKKAVHCQIIKDSYRILRRRMTPLYSHQEQYRLIVAEKLFPCTILSTLYECIPSCKLLERSEQNERTAYSYPDNIFNFRSNDKEPPCLPCPMRKSWP